MKTWLRRSLVSFLAIPFVGIEAATLHVAPAGDDGSAGTESAPFATLDKAVQAAADGDTIRIHPGTYRRVSTAFLEITKAVTVESVGGRDKVFLVGSEGKDEARGIKLKNKKAVFRGITLRGFRTRQYGSASGIEAGPGLVDDCAVLDCRAIDCKAAGVLVQDGGVVSNTLVAYCWIPDGAYDRRGAGVFVNSGTVSHCEIVSNEAPYAAGIAMEKDASLVTDCVIRHNRSFRGANHYESYFDNLGRGAGVCLDRGRIERCLIEGNEGDRAAGIHVANGTALNCIVTGNRSFHGPCGGLYVKGGTIRNVTTCDNFSPIGTGTDFTAESGDTANLVAFNTSLAKGLEVALGTSAKVASSASESLLPGDGNVVLAAGDLDPVTLAPYSASPAASGLDCTGLFSDDIHGKSRPASFGMGAVAPYGATDGKLALVADKPEGIAPCAVVFRATVNGDGAVGCAWTFEEGQTAEGPEVSHTFARPGRYLVEGRLPGGETSVCEVLVLGPVVAYASPSGGNVPPYDTPEKAAVSIQAAIDAVGSSSSIQGEVRLAPGIYSETDGDQTRVWAPMVSLTKNVRLVGLGDSREDVVLDAGGLRPLIHVSHPGAVVERMTLRNGRVKLQKYKAANLFLLDGVVTNCLVEKGYGSCYGNVSVGYGSLLGCEVREGKVDDGGESNVSGGVNVFGSARVEDCSIHGNMGNYGGGLFLADSDFTRGAVVRRCEIIGNADKGKPVTGCGGGGVVLRTGLVDSCVISNNATMKNGGGVAMDSKNDRSTLRNCLVAGNRAEGARYGFGYHEGGGGGGVSLRNGRVEHCTISGNRAKTATGADLCQLGGTVIHSIVYPDDPSLAPQSLYKEGGTLRRCCVGLSVGGIDELVADPMLEAPSEGRFGLLPGSPCIDRAEPMAEVTSDLAGAGRPIGPAPDLGCYEMADPVDFTVSFTFERSAALGPCDVTFTAQALEGVGAVSYEWDFGDGQTARTGEAVIAHPYGYGSFTVVLVARDEAGHVAVSKRMSCVNVVSDVAYVSETGSATWPYETWEKATPVVQDAIDAVHATDDKPGTVYLAKGTYKARAEKDSFVAVLQRPVRLIGAEGRHEAILDAEGIAQRRVVNVDHAKALLCNVACANGRYDEKAYFPGPGIWLTDGVVSNVAVRGCEGSAGGVSMWGGLFTDGVISDCISATGHRWDRNGGGAHLRGGTLQRTTIARCSSGYGGGLYLYGSSAIVRDCVIEDCDTYAGGVIYLYCGLLENCVIRGNRNRCVSGYDSKGIALYAREHQGKAIVRNCLFVDNTGYDQTYGQYGVYLTKGATFLNCTVWGNRNDAAPAPVGGVMNDGGQVYNTIAPSIEGNGTAASNYTGETPRFTNEARGNYHLSSASPCLDAGDVAHWGSVLPVLDLDGSARIHGKAIDLGPYEFHGRTGTLLLVR